MDKQKIRNKMKSLRDNLSKEEVANYSKTICSTLLETLKSFNNNNIFIYNSFKNEVYTKELIQQLYKSNNIFLPRIDGNNMYAVKLSKRSIFQTNSFGIQEPSSPPANIDNFICILPLLAVDENGNRIGFGKGYYDRFLENKNCIKIGLCYDFQIIKGIPHESYDIPLDIIISEKRTIKLF